MGKRIISAGIVGGCFGVVTQLLIMLFSKFTPDPMLALVFTMSLVVIISFFLIIFNVYPKISKIGFFGGDFPLSGLIYGASNLTAMTRKAGASAGSAFLKGFGIMSGMVFGSFAFCILIGIVTIFIAK